MKKQTINIHREAIINAIGKYNSGHCKPAVCLETGDIYSSIKDAANKAEVSYSLMNGHLHGKFKSVKGKHYRYLSDVLDDPNIMFTNQRKYYAQVVADADDARKWREYQAQKAAEEEAERKRLEEERIAKEKHDAAVAKAEAKVQTLTNKCAETDAKLQKLTEELLIAMQELDDLKHSDI